MNILIIDNGLEIEHRIYEQKPLGGSELNLLLISEGLSFLNHKIFFLCNTRTKSLHSNIVYDNISNLNDYLNYSDVIIYSRNLTNPELINFLFNFKKSNPSIPIILQTGDAYDQFIISPLFDIRYSDFFSNLFDKIICVSSWQKNTFIAYSNIKPDKFDVIPNASFKFDWIFGHELRDEYSMIFASIPFKGLEFVYYIHNDVRKILKSHNTRLYCFSSYSLYNTENDPQTNSILSSLSRDPLVTVSEPLPVIDLIHLFKKCKIYLHPSLYHETFSMVSVQAMVCGCIPVYVDNGSLSEIIGDGGIKTNLKDIRDYACYKEFLFNTVDALTSDLSSIRDKAYNKSKQYEYINVSRIWETKLSAILFSKKGA